MPRAQPGAERENAGLSILSLDAPFPLTHNPHPLEFSLDSEIEVETKRIELRIHADWRG